MWKSATLLIVTEKTFLSATINKMVLNAKKRPEFGKRHDKLIFYQ